MKVQDSRPIAFGYSCSAQR